MSGPARQIKLENVSHSFAGRGGTGVLAVDDFSLTLNASPSRIVSLVGASGSGKSTVARIILGLLEPTKGRVNYGTKSIFRLNRRERREFRRDVQAVFQDPYAIFNPVYRVDRVFWKAIHRFRLASNRDEALERVETSLRAVNLQPGEVLGRYPHQLSGGQRQRLMLARAHLLQPRFLIADEPVSMLDAQVRRSFLDVLTEFQHAYNMTTLFITHDLSTVAYVADEMLVMLRGRIVEYGAVDDIMANPQHDYTRLLLASVPGTDPAKRWHEEIDPQIADLVDNVPQ